jgi:hypothetical protein
VLGGNDREKLQHLSDGDEGDSNPHFTPREAKESVGVGSLTRTYIAVSEEERSDERQD